MGGASITPMRYVRYARYAATGLAAVLAEQGRKQAWLAERSGVSEAFISRLLRGTLTVDRAQGERMASLLGVPFFVLFELHDRSEMDSPAEDQP